MQALFLFLSVFFAIFGAAVFVRIVYSAALKIISERKEKNDGRRK